MVLPVPLDRIWIGLLLRSVVGVSSYAFLRGKWHGEVLQPGKKVNACARRWRRVSFAVCRGMNQRRGPPPVLIGSVRIKNFWHGVRLRGRIQQAGLCVGVGIILR